MKPASSLLLVGLLSLFMPCAIAADRDSAEFRLLKSWGMQFNAEGQLYFKLRNPDTSSSESPWKPDVPDYQSKIPQQIGEPLEPLIISSKKAKKP